MLQGTARKMVHQRKPFQLTSFDPLLEQLGGFPSAIGPSQALGVQRSPQMSCLQRSGCQCSHQPPQTGGSTSYPSPATSMIFSVCCCSLLPLHCLLRKPLCATHIRSRKHYQFLPDCLRKRPASSFVQRVLSKGDAEGTGASHLRHLRMHDWQMYLWEDIKADLAANGVHKIQVSELFPQNAHKLLPAQPARGLAPCHPLAGRDLYRGVVRRPHSAEHAAWLKVTNPKGTGSRPT